MLHNFFEEDLIVIKDDLQTIINKIKTRKAHELLESDANYLRLCSK